jgi:PAS domain S-box-containing protein
MPSQEAAYGRWVDAWRTAVSESPGAVALIHLPSTRLVALSTAMADLLGVTPDEGMRLDCLTLVRPTAAAVDLMSQGVLDAIEARRQLERPDGSLIDVRSAGWAIRSHTGPDLCLWAPSPTTCEPIVTEAVAAACAPVGKDARSVQLVAGRLDHRWQVVELNSEAEVLLGSRADELIGRSIFDLVHRDDAVSMLSGFARATAKGAADVRIRFSHQDGIPRLVRAVLTAVDGDTVAPFGFAVALVATVTVAGRAEMLEQHLRRIAAEISAAGLGRAEDLPMQLSSPPALRGLSVRQREVVLRLIRGERVPAIADAMFLSQSTVRNHLAAIFEKAGVHSQSDLIQLVREQTSSGSSSTR